MVLVLAVANTSMWFFTMDDRVGTLVQHRYQRAYLEALEREGKMLDAFAGIDSGMFTGLSSPSLEMKENVDFFLTPALLVQESISENVIITYPGE